MDSSIHNTSIRNIQKIQRTKPMKLHLTKKEARILLIICLLDITIPRTIMTKGKDYLKMAQGTYTIREVDIKKTLQKINHQITEENK